MKGIDAGAQDFSGKSEKADEILAFLRAIETVLTADEAAAIDLIRKYGLVHEHLPTHLLNSKLVRVFSG